MVQQLVALGSSSWRSAAWPCRDADARGTCRCLYLGLFVRNSHPRKSRKSAGCLLVTFPKSPRDHFSPVCHLSLLLIVLDSERDYPTIVDVEGVLGPSPVYPDNSIILGTTFQLALISIQGPFLSTSNHSRWRPLNLPMILPLNVLLYLLKTVHHHQTHLRHPEPLESIEVSSLA